MTKEGGAEKFMADLMAEENSNETSFAAYAAKLDEIERSAPVEVRNDPNFIYAITELRDLLMKEAHPKRHGRQKMLSALLEARGSKPMNMFGRFDAH